MSDISDALGEVEMKYLLPNQIQVIPEYNVRFWGSNEEKENQKIEWLATSLERDGQIDDCVVRPGRSGEWVLFVGHRRRRAACLINERRAAMGARELFKLRCRVDHSGGDIKRKAIVSNLHREDFTPMDLAQLIGDLKKENGWEGYKGAKQVALYLGVDVSTVTQHERFLGADPQIQRDLRDGKLTAMGAFTLLDGKPEKRPEVMRVAEREQAREDIRMDKSVPVDKRTGEPKPNKIHQPSIVKAMREVDGATEKDIPRKRTEIVEWLESLDGPGYGFPDSAVREWAREMLGEWLPGKGKGDEGMMKKFDRMVSQSYKGKVEYKGEKG